MVQNRDRAVAREHEVAVHAVDEVFGCGMRDGGLRGGEALGDYGTPVDTARTRGVPEFTGVGENVLGKVASQRDSWGMTDIGMAWDSTGPIGLRGVRARTFSIGDLEGSGGGGVMRVEAGMFARETRVGFCQLSKGILVL